MMKDSKQSFHGIYDHKIYENQKSRLIYLNWTCNNTLTSENELASHLNEKKKKKKKNFTQHPKIKIVYRL